MKLLCDNVTRSDGKKLVAWWNAHIPSRNYFLEFSYKRNGKKFYKVLYYASCNYP
jgi:hypothetical protein